MKSCLKRLVRKGSFECCNKIKKSLLKVSLFFSKKPVCLCRRVFHKSVLGVFAITLMRSCLFLADFLRLFQMLLGVFFEYEMKI